MLLTDEDSDPEDRMPARNVSWRAAAWIINAGVVGMGVLTIPSCFVSLGWILASVALVACLFANVLVAKIMLDVQELHPRAITLADAAQIAAGGSRTVKVVFRSALYVEKLASTSVFLTAMADTLGSAFYSVHWCEVTWCALLVILFLPMMQLKNLHETFWLNIVNFGSIVAVVLLTCLKFVLMPRAEEVETSLYPVAASFQNFFGAMSMMVFAYSGNWMYFELMSEMTEPKTFLKAFTIAGPTQLALYTMVGFVCYGTQGEAVASSIVEALPFSPVMRVISFILVVHLVTGTGTNMVVLIRFFHSRVSPQDINEGTFRANAIRTVIYLTIICGLLVVALSVNGIAALVTLVGAFFEAPLSFICPFLIYGGVMRRRPRRRTWSAFFTWAGSLVIALVGVMIMIFGVMDAVTHLQKLSPASGLFSCKCQGLWDTCECSASRMSPDACPTNEQHFFQHGQVPPLWAENLEFSESTLYLSE